MRKIVVRVLVTSGKNKTPLGSIFIMVDKEKMLW